jgi:hypothetical protein
MSLLDSLVGAQFRNENAGRVIVFAGDRRGRGYVVRSEAEEQKIRSFLKMFYCAHFSIMVLGFLLASGWSHDIYTGLGRPAEHLYRAMGIAFGVYFLVVGVPYLLLWRSYKKAFVNFVSPQDEVVVSGGPPRQKQIYIVVAIIAFALLLALGVFFLVRAK